MTTAQLESWLKTRPEYQASETPTVRNDARSKDARRKREDRSENARIVIPDCVNPARRERCLADPELFLMTYFENDYRLGFGADHTFMIDAITTRARTGGRQAVAAPRGRGKSQIVKGMLAYLACRGLTRFPLSVAATSDLAKMIYKDFKKKFATNEKLRDDFPEICHPIRELDGAPQRASRQHIDGKLTGIVWTDDYIRFPDVTCDNAICKTYGGFKMSYYGLDAAFRGVNIDADRPDFILVDDPETREALAIDTPIPTACGFKPMGDISLGDSVFDEKGNACKVIGVSDVYEDRECYLIEFDDGSTIVADAGHLWVTSNSTQRCNQRRKRKVLAGTFHQSLRQCQPKPYATIRTTKEIHNTLHAGKEDRKNHSVLNCFPVEGTETNLPIDPYVLGVWLGGKKQLKSGSDAYSVSIKGLRRLLRENDLLGNKHVPSKYFFSSRSQRLELLRGLMDTGGWIGSREPRCGFSNTNRLLVDAVYHLCCSLGIKTRVDTNKRKHESNKDSWTVYFTTDTQVFRLAKKAERIPESIRFDCKSRYIASVTKVDSVKVKCIAVDSPSRMYLCGTSFVPTHNSAKSFSQIEDRENILDKDISGLVGQDDTLAIVVLTTVQNRISLSYKLTDVKLKSAYNGKRFGMVLSWPKNIGHWDRYVQLRKESQIEGDEHGGKAVAYYLDNFGEMNEGVEMLSDHFVDVNREDGSETVFSAIQQAYNKIADTNRKAYDTEYQNDPPEEAGPQGNGLTFEVVASRVSGLSRRQLPANTTALTAAIDLGKYRCHWVVSAWWPGAGGVVVDYGIAEVVGTDKSIDNEASEPMIFKTLLNWRDELLQKNYTDATGTVRKIDFALVDSGTFTNAAYEFCRQVKGIFHPSKGINPYNPRKQSSATVMAGANLHAQRLAAQDIWLYELDTNHWKQWTHERFLTPTFDENNMLRRGSLSIYQPEGSQKHISYAQHIASEELLTEFVEGKGVKTKWFANNDNNHWLDATYMAAAASEVCGVKLLAQSEVEVTPRHVDKNKPKPQEQARQHGNNRFKKRPGGWVPRRR